MNVIVLGGSGLIGNAVVRELKARGHDVAAAGRRPGPTRNLLNLDVDYVSGDANDADTLVGWARGRDAVIDAAAPYALRLTDRDAIGKAGRRARDLVAAVSKHGCRLVHVSSQAAQPGDGKRRETRRRVNRLLHPYFAQKKAFEERLLAACEQGVDALVVSPTVCLGPWDVKERESCWVPALLNGDIAVTPEQRLNVIDTRDVAAAVVSLMEGSRVGGPINLSGHNTTTSELFSELCDAAGRQNPRFRMPALASAVPAVVSELALAALGQQSPIPAIVPMLLSEQDWTDPGEEQASLGARPRPLRDTARDTVNWYRRLGYC